MRVSAAEFRQQVAKPNKYRNQPIELDGIRFQSKAEARYYAQLKLREKAGEVYGVELQKPFPLTCNGFLVGNYKADFSFFDHKENRIRVIDIKGGPLTDLFKFKAKFVKALHGVDIEIVRMK